MQRRFISKTIVGKKTAAVNDNDIPHPEPEPDYTYIQRPSDYMADYTSLKRENASYTEFM